MSKKLYDILPDWAWSIYCLFRTGKRRIRRFIAWFPVIWNDEDWDEHYLYEIMRFKISMIRRNIAENKSHVGWEKDVQNMKRAEFLLGRIGWGDFKHDNNNRYRDWIKEGKCTCPEEIMTFEDFPDRQGGRIHFHFCDFCDKFLKHAHRRENKKERFDIDYTFKFIAKKSSKWWD